MITRSDFSASLRIAFRTLGASRRMPSACPRACCFRKCGQRLLGLRPNGGREARRHNVEHGDAGAVPPGQRVREAQRQLGVRAAPDGDQDPVDLGDRALLDDRDVAGRFADDRIDRRAEDERRLVRRIGVAGAAAGRSARADAHRSRTGLPAGRPSRR